MLTLAQYPDIQQKCFDEIQAAQKMHGEVVKEHCPYLRDGNRNYEFFALGYLVLGYYGP